MWKTLAVLCLRVSIKLYPLLADWIEGMLKAPPPPDMDPLLHSTVGEMLPNLSASAEAAKRIRELKAAKGQESEQGK